MTHDVGDEDVTPSNDPGVDHADPAVESDPSKTRSQRRFERAQRVRRFTVLTFLSTLIPGLGLLWTKRRRLGIALVALTVLASLIFLIWLVSGGAISGAAEVLTKNGLRIAFAAVVVGVLLWLASILITARTTHPTRWSKRGELFHKAFTALMCVLVILPAAQAIRYVAVTQDAFGAMFIKNKLGADNGKDPLAQESRVNFLLLGSDAGTDRTGTRTDSLMVVSIDTKTGDTTMISIPRNLNYVPFPDDNPLHKIYPKGFNCPQRGPASPCWMDAVWAEAEVSHPEVFPKGEQYKGLNTTREVVSQITGLTIDYTTVIDLEGFRDLVNAMGGVDITVPAGGIAIGGRIENGAIVPGSITGRIPAGKQHLNGQLALWYARSRVETGDGDRMRRQRCMLNALIDQSNPVELVQEFPDIMRVAKKNILIDMPQDDLPDLANLAKKMKHGSTKSVNLAYPIISDANPDFAKIRQLIQQGLKRSKTSPSPHPSTSSSTSKSSSSSGSSSSTTTEQAVSDTAASC